MQMITCSGSSQTAPAVMHQDQRWVVYQTHKLSKLRTTNLAGLQNLIRHVSHRVARHSPTALPEGFGIVNHNLDEATVYAEELDLEVQPESI
jgi:hypothetical protein